MSQIPTELHYTTTHEWIRVEPEGHYTIGITDHAQHLLGDVVYVELPAVGRKVEMGQEISVIESVKAAADVYSPLSGEVIAINEQLNTHPQWVNQTPYTEGWLVKLKANDVRVSDWLDAKTYEVQLG